MNAELGCVFCSPSIKGSTAPWDQLLDETGSYAVYPTKGALLPGWQLVVPKRHLINSSLLNKEEINELEKLIDKRAKIASSIYKNPIAIFEHGSHIPACEIGCGVDHAHIHIVPVPFDFEKVALTSEHGNLFESKSSSLSDFLSYQRNIKDTPYWFFYVHDSNKMYYSHRIPSTSQFFRKLIAREIQTPELYDYKKYHFIDNVHKTILDFTLNKSSRLEKSA